jgi:hypothetical protein
MVTKKKQLHAGQSIWMAFPSPRIVRQTALHNMKADVLIIGAGISGALIRLWPTQAMIWEGGFRPLSLFAHDP